MGQHWGPCLIIVTNTLHCIVSSPQLTLVQPCINSFHPSWSLCKSSRSWRLTCAVISAQSWPRKLDGHGILLCLAPVASISMQAYAGCQKLSILADSLIANGDIMHLRTTNGANSCVNQALKLREYQTDWRKEKILLWHPLVQIVVDLSQRCLYNITLCYMRS